MTHSATRDVEIIHKVVATCRYRLPSFWTVRLFRNKEGVKWIHLNAPWGRHIIEVTPQQWVTTTQDHWKRAIDAIIWNRAYGGPLDMSFMPIPLSQYVLIEQELC